MNSIRSQFLVPRTPTSRHLNTALVNLNHNLASNATPSFPYSIAEDPAKALPNLLSNCTNVLHLDQVYAQIITTRVLEFYPAAFHWNNIIRSYTRLNAPIKALYVYIAMSRAGVLPDRYTLPIILKATCQCFAVNVGRQLHSTAIKIGLELNEFCESGFINLYTKAGEFDNVRKVFDENPERKLGSWNAVIGGLSQSGRAKEAIYMFLELKKCGFWPDDVTMVSVTSSCGSLGDLELALQLHKCVFQAKSSGRSHILMLNSVIDMYGKCGQMDLAYLVFSKMKEKNVSSWTSMIVGYAMHGQVEKALGCFLCMREVGIRPNHVTFVGVLSACVHGGKVDEGRFYFDMMQNVYGIRPTSQHYGCMVDLLGRAGLLKEARKMVEEMPMKPNVVIWGCLMGACEKFGSVEMGEWVAKHLQELEPWNDGVYVVLSNIYASNGLWKEVEKVRGIMKQRKLAKLPGYSLSTSSN
ncbi:hypothetical protein COLO4_34773 [Corchorus olitorius]|uniref:Pentatricopeptide repeat-containing protein n=1 Tax=Corchorus olitorius TaxID=93759 RepID=A0A1R3GJP7_9ROSI|nr:hypothetical protein COLO4_34773 [Corchorus olitorius]